MVAQKKQTKLKTTVKEKMGYFQSSYCTNIPHIQKELTFHSITFLQIMDEEGNVNEKIKPNVTDKELISWYTTMVLARRVDEKMLSLQRQGRMATFAQVKGQEACQVPAVAALQNDDWIVQAFRETAVMLARGVPAHSIMSYYGGNEQGSVFPKNTNMLPVAIPVASQLLHGMGIAWGMKLKKEKKVTLTYFSDGATSEGDFHEALNFAAVFKVPAIFLCQNNQWAISVPRARQTASQTIAQKAIAYDIEGLQIDGNDVFAVYHTIKYAAEKARKGLGPTLIEAYTYRLGDHTTSDDARHYRSEEELQLWQKKDPLLRLQKYMFKKGLWNKEKETQLLKDIDIQIEKEVHIYETTPLPDVGDMFKYTYKELTPELKEQSEYQKKFERKSYE